MFGALLVLALLRSSIAISPRLNCSDLRIAFPFDGQSIILEEKSTAIPVLADIDLLQPSLWLGYILEISLLNALDVIITTTFRIRLKGNFDEERIVLIGTLPKGVYKLSLKAVSPGSSSICDSIQYFNIFTSSVANMLSSEQLPCPLELRENYSEDLSNHFLTQAEEQWHSKRLCLETFVQRYPKNLNSIFLLAKIYESSGLWKMAAKSFDKILQLTAFKSNQADQASARFMEHWSKDLIVSQHLHREESYTDPPNCAWKVTEHHSPTNFTNPDSDSVPYLSVIMTFRHDDSLYCRVPRDACVDRLRAALTLLLYLLAKHALPSEIILVEWNPCRLRSHWPCRRRPTDYLTAAEVVRQLVPAPAGPLTVRTLEVSEWRHAEVYNPYGYDHLEHHGKNAGARRARGRFLAFTNPDDLWPEALVERLARRDLREDAVYSADRGDVAADAPPFARPEGLLRFFERYSVIPLPAAIAAAAHEAHAAASHVQRRNAAAGAAAAGATVAGGGGSGGFRFAACLAGEDDDPAAAASDQALHTNAPGDFTLAPRWAVAKARGIPEVPTNTHVDSMAVCALVAHGLGQLVLPQPCKVYHQPHPRNDASSFEVLSEDERRRIFHAILLAGPLANQRPDVDESGEALLWEESVPWERWNTEDWGLGRETLPETTLTPSCGPNKSL